MKWPHFAVPLPGPRGIIKEKMNFQVYKNILQVNVMVAALKLSRSWVMQHNDQDH